MSEHAPGPWKARGPVRPIWAQPLVDANGESVDQTHSPNANIIRAAPIMLDTLLWIAEDYKDAGAGIAARRVIESLGIA